MFRNSVLVTLMTLLGAALSLVNQLILARTFGAGISMDAFLAGTSLPTMAAGIIAASLNYSLPPHLILQRNKNSTDYPRAAGSLHTAIIALALLIFGVGAIFSGPILKIISPHLAESTFRMAAPIARIAWLTGIATLSQVYLTCTLNVEDRFFLPAVVALLHYLSMICFTLIFGRILGPLATVIGLLVGAYTAAVLLSTQAARHIRLLSWREDAMDSVGPFVRKIPLFIISMLCFTVYQTIDTYWAPGLGEGSLSALGYNQRMLIAVGNLVIAGPSAVLMPRLSAAYLKEDKGEFNTLAQTAFRLVFAFSGLVAVIAILLRHSIVSLLFGRGSMGIQSQERVVALMPYMMTGMVAMLCVVILFRILYAKHNFYGTMAVGGICSLGYFLFSGFLSIKFKIQGIGMAYAISWLIGLFIANYFVWDVTDALAELRSGFIFYIRTITSIATTALLLKIIIHTLQLFVNELFDKNLAILVSVGVSTVSGLCIFIYFSIWLFRIKEIHFLYTLIINFLTRSITTSPRNDPYDPIQ